VNIICPGVPTSTWINPLGIDEEVHDTTLVAVLSASTKSNEVQDIAHVVHIFWNTPDAPIS
jgi:hypothetical protein